MRNIRHMSLKRGAAALFAMCAVFLCARAEDYTYQSLTNLGPRASSRVLLLNDDTNPICPIEGQGYYATNVNDVAVGGTYWWHDDVTPEPSGLAKTYLNLLPGSNHELRQKLDSSGSYRVLWTLNECRTGSGGYNATSGNNGSRNYLPWSDTCQPIDATYATAPIPATWKTGAANLGGIKQVAHITMRCTTDACVYSPLYEEGVGNVFFDAVNGFSVSDPDEICFEVAYDIKPEYAATETYGDGLDLDHYDWRAVPCDVFVVKDKSTVTLEHSGVTVIPLKTTSYRDTMYYRVRYTPASGEERIPMRFRIRRLNVQRDSNLDYYNTIFLDNIVVSYPGVVAEVSSSGIKAAVLPDNDNRKNGRRADVGHVGAFSEPLLSIGAADAKPRMAFSAVTNGAPPWIEPQASVSKAQCVYRWRYLDQAFGEWKTNVTENISILNGTNVVWDSAIDVPDRLGDIEYSYGAWVSGTRYKYLDFANNSQIPFPDDTAASSYVQCATNYTARIRAGASPWQEMHIVTEVYTNLATLASVTNDWTMELTASNMWRGFVDTRTNYTGKIAHIRIVGKNRWEKGGFAPAEESRTWYMPEIDRIPDGYKVLDSIPEGGETDITLDCSTGYLSIDFNDEAKTFTINHAEYQDFNLWTPRPGEENKYVGDYVNTTYVGRAKTAYNLDVSAWDLSRSSSAWWWENFDAYAGNPDFPFNVPFGQNQKTPNGWTFDNGMYINGYFTAETNKAAGGMALQLQGRGIGSIALIDPVDRPNGIGTISFTARLAQYLEFGDFYCNLDGFTDSNYAFSAKAAMTHTIQNNNRPESNDISFGTPSISLAAYYRPGSGCYEVRISRVWASRSSMWSAANGVMELAIYRWNIAIDASGNRYWQSKKLKSRRLGNRDGYGLTSDDKKYNQGNFLAPVANSAGIDNGKWTSVFVAAYNTANGTYVEGAISRDQVAAYSGLTGDRLLQNAVLQDMRTSGRMFSISVTDNEIETNEVNGVSIYKNLYHSKGSYGICSMECPAAFGALVKYTISSGGPYYNAANKFTSPTLQRDSIKNGEWGSVSPYRMITFDEHRLYYPEEPTYIGIWEYGVCAAPISQKLKLLAAPSGNTSDWTPTGLELDLRSYQPTNLVFSPHTLESCNVKLSVGGSQNDSRTDVVVDDLQLSQWAAETSSYSLGEMNDWAYSHGWITSSTNDVYMSGGASTNDPIATITRCGYAVYKVPGTTDDYVYVFTNTVNGALGGYARFIPSANMTMIGAFGLGGGGGGGAGGGGGGGGSAFVITNSAAFNIGEEIRVNVGAGGVSSGWNADPTKGTKKTYRGDWFGTSNGGGNSYLRIRPLGSSGTAYTEYYAYGGGRGGNWRDGGSYVQGGNGTSSKGAGGGSARYTVSATGTGAHTSNSSGYPSHGSGMGAGVTNKNESAAGGGGGGLVVYRGTSSVPLNNSDVLVRGGDGGHGTAGVTGVAGLGGTGFKVRDIPSEAIRDAIKSIYGLGDSDGMGGGGGGGGGTNTTTNAGYFGYGAGGGPGKGRDGGTDGDAMSSTYNSATWAADARNGLGGGGGGGSIHAIMNSSGNSARNWLTRGGRGGDGLVAIHVRVNDRAVLLQPMRGTPTAPMAVRTPFLNGISSLGVSWNWAHSNALLRVQVMTNGVNESNIDGRSLLLEGGWHDKGIIDFSKMSAEERAGGSTNVLIGYRAPISGIARVLMDTNIVATARVGSTNNLDSLYGAVAITALVAIDEPQLDDRSWWGWNIMSTDAREYGSLYDHTYDVTAGLLSGRSCSLNFSGVAGTGDDDPRFAEDPDVAQYSKHDPFVQTPNFTNGIGQIMFSARMLETNGVNGWVSISGCADPNEEDDDKWHVITNIEVSAESPLFRQHVWRMPSDYSSFTAVRLSAFAAAEGRHHQADSKVPFGTTGSTVNPVPIQRVLLDEITVMQPMTPGLAFAYPPRPYRFNGTTKTDTKALPADKVQSADVQPLLNESFGMQVQLVPAGLDEELDRSSVRVFMSWYAGESPWGYVNWKGASGAHLGIELVKAEDWSENNLVYHSSPTDASTLVPPQIAGPRGFEIVQYHIHVKYNDRNGVEHDRVMQVGADWTEPSWYVFVGGSPYNRSGATCAYTILDEISPKRAWINELNMFRHGDLGDAKHQYIEVAVPQGLGLTGWSIDYLPYDTTIVSHSLASFGYGDVVASKTEHGSSQYAFIAIQSPQTKSAGTYNTAEHNYLNDGTWSESVFNSGVLNVRYPYAVRLLRPTGIVEHEIVFMCTNTSTSRVRYTYDGTNYLRVIKAALNDDAWIYAGADDDGTAATDYSLGVYRSHGESISCWTNWMVHTPGRLNRLVDGTAQTIDPSYFEPPEGSHLWVYVSVDSASRNSLWVKTGPVKSSSAVLIVPQDALTGTYSTSVVYEVKNWFDIDSVVTNSYGEPGAVVPGPYAKDGAGLWTLDLSNMTLPDDSSRKFFVTASTAISSKVPDAANGGIASGDPYYPAVLDWLQNYEEGDIHLARFYGMDNNPVMKPDGSEMLLPLKEMYWLDIPPVSTSSGSWEWLLRAGMGGGGNGASTAGIIVTRDLDGVTVTNVFVTVSMMISNRVTNVAYPPYTLRGLEPGSVSSNYNEHVSSWTSATFKVEGALQNGIVNDVWRPIRWFTLCPESFGAPGTPNEFSRKIELPAPADTGYDWESFPDATPFYRFSIDERLGPVTIYQLNDNNALLNPPSGSGTP